jgi:hypothetical protein
MMANESLGFKRSAFFKTKDGIIEFMCQTMHSKDLQGHPIQVLCQDNAGENVKLVRRPRARTGS